MPKAKQFDFNPTQIFGKFELFSRRVGKLIELFGTIKQLKKKNHRLLDFVANIFDRDFVEFKTDVSQVETEL